MEKEEVVKTPKPRGGYRPNAGRKPKYGVEKDCVCVRLDKKHVQIIKETHDNLSEFIYKAVKEKLRREGLI